MGSKQSTLYGNNKKQVTIVTAPPTALNDHMASKHDDLENNILDLYS
jgi:hypothetical protein